MSKKIIGSCDRCGKNAAVNTPYLLVTGELICHYCKIDEDKFGRGVNQHTDENGNLRLTDNWIKYDVVLSMVGSVSIWTKNGIRTWYPSHDEESLLKNGKIEEALDLIHERDKDGVMRCSSCGIVIDEPAGTHFAGVYCEDCWAEYKETHSQKCSICGKPGYRCVC